MRIIERRDPNDKEHEWVCTKCKSRIASNQNEGKYISDQRDGDCIRFVCPVCEKLNYIDIKFYKD